jgi:hypothetical protein
LEVEGSSKILCAWKFFIFGVDFNKIWWHTQRKLKNYSSILLVKNPDSIILFLYFKEI